jgi:hypothetical protein
MLEKHTKCVVMGSAHVRTNFEAVSTLGGEDDKHDDQGCVAAHDLSPKTGRWQPT